MSLIESKITFCFFFLLLAPQHSFLSP
uniref:Uncharacterized protein n=1 Tax=Rhizophora mucronata TaxID=61149 RepID=A0A2P2NEI6_RHIMU